MTLMVLIYAMTYGQLSQQLLLTVGIMETPIKYYMKYELPVQ